MPETPDFPVESATVYRRETGPFFTRFWKVILPVVALAAIAVGAYYYWFYVRPANSLTGSILVSAVDITKPYESSHIYLVSIDGKKVTEVTKVSSGDFNPDYNKTKKKIAFMRSFLNYTEIITQNLDGTDYQQVTTTKTQKAWPKWAPDGTSLLYLTRDSETYSVHLFNSASKVDKALNLDPLVNSPDWNTTTGNFVYLYTSPKGRKVVEGTVAGVATRLPINATGYLYTWSPDGDRLAYINVNDQQIYLIGKDGKNDRKITDVKDRFSFVSWSPDGKSILAAYRSFGHDNVDSLATIDVASGKISKILVPNLTTFNAPKWVDQ